MTARRATDDGTQDSEAVELTAQLVAVDSVNPGLIPGAAGESRIADLVSAWLTARDFVVTRCESHPGRPSILATAAGSGGGRSLMLNGHLDTVGLAGYDAEPLVPVVRDGRLHGRGAYDMKSGIAAMMVAAARAHRDVHSGDIVLALVADEEHRSSGTEEVLRQIRTDAAIVCEPSGTDVVLAHKGFCWFDVTVGGRAAHGSRPDLGIDAIAKTGAVLVGLDRLAERLARGPAHPLLGRGSIHAGIIRGGQETSSYAARCTVSVERRTIPGEDAATTEAELRAILDPLARADPDVTFQLSRGLQRAPFEAPPRSLILATVLNAIADNTGVQAHTRGEAFWTDCALLAETGIPALIYGVDGAGAHAAEEWVSLDSLTEVTAVLEMTIRRFCR